MSEPTDNLQIIRTQQLAAKLGISAVTVWRMRDELPPKIQVSKGIAGWRTRDIDAWLEKRSVR